MCCRARTYPGRRHSRDHPGRRGHHGQLTGGQLGANITLRDTTLPTYQAELDEFSQNLASRFSAQGLTLFSDPTGNVPAGGGMPVQQRLCRALPRKSR